MTTHTAKIVRRERRSDGCIALLARCCDDESTDSWHSIYIDPDTTTAQLDAESSGHIARVAAQHAAMVAAEEYLAGK